MRNINADTITQAVIARHAAAGDARLREVMTSLVQHLHAFAREVRLDEAECAAALRFLAEAGRLSDDTRPELAWLADVLGLSALVASMARTAPSDCTEATAAAPGVAPDGHAGEPCFVRGRVRSAAGGAIAGAVVRVRPEGPAQTSDGDGRFLLRTVASGPIAIPDDGPVGRLLAALGRHPWRPPHLQVAISAPGHAPLQTQLFREGAHYLDSDAAFGVRESLVAEWVRHGPGRMPDGGFGDLPFYTLDFDFVLQPLEARR